MAFLFYFVVVLVTAASVMFGLDLATSPLPPGPNVPIGRVAYAPPPAHADRASAKAKRAADNRELSPVYPAAPGVPKEQAKAAEATTGAAVRDAASQEWLPPAPKTQQAARAPVPQPYAAASPQQSALRQPRTATSAQPEQAAATSASQSDDNDKEAAATSTNAAVSADVKPQPAVARSTAHCDVAACDAAYHSFRASDCTYQPYQGPRRVCTRTGGTVASTASSPRRHAVEPRVQEVEASRSARDQHELDEVTRIVRHMTRGEDGDVPVQDSRGRIIIVHPGRARAYSPFGYYDNGD
jgi:BA14K-like protein